MRLMKRAALDQSKINKILEILKAGGRGKVKLSPLQGAPNIDKIVMESSAPQDNPNALAYVTQGSDDIHLILPAIEKSIKEQMTKEGLDPNDLSTADFNNLDNNPKLDSIIIILSAALQIFSHELGHLKGLKDPGGELKSEQFAEEEARRSMDTMKVSAVKTELRKLASELDNLGEYSFVKDIFLIESMLPKEEVNGLPEKMAQKDLDFLAKDLEKLFMR